MCLANWTRLDTWAAVMVGALIAIVLGTIAGLGGLVALRSLLPLSYELKTITVKRQGVEVGDDRWQIFKLGEPIYIWPTRTVRRPVTVWIEFGVYRAGSALATCQGWAPVINPYNRVSAFPESIPLSLLTQGSNPPCQSQLLAGTFTLEACAHGQADGFLGLLLGQRVSCATSNTFEVEQ